ncbi:MAG: RNA polymerase sporulation sigma factor SigK [Clostridia bacterium]|nr:RNA polymerase sporulation sigma factor SigK [Clostridia bacterium]
MIFEFLNFIVGKFLFFCGAIYGDCFPKPLSKEEESKYLKLYKENNDLKAKDVLIKHNLRLVAHIAKKYQGADDVDDIISTGTIGLIKAINTYDSSKGTQLATYTARCIENEILMLLRQNKKYNGTVLLSDSIGTDKEGNELTLMDLLADDGDSLINQVERNIEKRKLIEIMQKCLSKREFTVMCLRYGLKNGKPLPQREVALFLKISRSYISRIEKKAIEKIKIELKKG